jgi:DNA mismatch endonuclease (patch repair protein)
MTRRRGTDSRIESELRPYKKVEKRLAGGKILLTDRMTSQRMSRVPRTRTRPELAVRRRAWSLGLRFSTRSTNLPGTPDLVNRRRGLVVFVHGCFWHRHTNCPLVTTPKRNAIFWRRKFERNKQRDRDAISTLTQLGFRVVVIWECEVKDDQVIADRLLEAASE